jgi:hypothetical protein
MGRGVGGIGGSDDNGGGIDVGGDGEVGEGDGGD